MRANALRIAAAFVALPLLAIAVASRADAQDRRFDDVTEVLVVEVPVQVLDDGQPVRGLTIDDFEVLEGRKKQRIVGFDVVDLTVTGTGERPATHPIDIPAGARRHILLLFDLALSRPAAVVQARQAAKDLVANALHPSDLVAVGVYSSNRGAQLVTGFTPDRRQVALAIETLGLPSLLDKAPDPLALIVSDLGTGTLDAGGGGGGARGGIDAGAEIQALLEEVETRIVRAEERNRVLALTGSLAELANMMAAIDGRKQVVFLSEGFDSSVLVGTGVSTEEERAQQQAQAESAASGRFWEVDSQGRFGDTSTLNQLELMAQEFLRADCSVQSVDIGGLRAGNDVQARRSGDDGLFMLADKTGGEHFRNFNDLGAAMGKMLERTSVTYLLAIQPEMVENDGQFRRLRVRLKGGPRGAKVTHRPGYFAPRPSGERNPLEERMRAADAIVGGRAGGSITTSVLSAPFLTGYGTAYMPVLIEIDGASLMAGRAEGTLPTEIYAYAIGADGSVVDYFTRSLAFDLAKVGPALGQSGFKYWGHFELPPGDYAVRVMVREATSGASGVSGTRVRVPSPEGGPELSAPFFPEPAGKWLLGREEDAGEQGFDYPFMLSGEAFIPAAKPVVRANQAQRVALVGYHLGESPELSGRLLDADGESVEGARLELEESAPGSTPGEVRLVGYLETGELSPGVYTLEISATGGEGASVRSSIDVVVES